MLKANQNVRLHQIYGGVDQHPQSVSAVLAQSTQAGSISQAQFPYSQAKNQNIPQNAMATPIQMSETFRYQQQRLHQDVVSNSIELNKQ